MGPKKDKTEDSDLSVTKALKNLQDEIGRMNDTMQTVRSEVTNLRDNVIKINIQLDTIKDLKKSVENAHESLNYLSIGFADLQGMIATQTKRIDILEENIKQKDIVNAKLENQILYLDTYIRRESLIFGGIQEEPNESSIRTAEKLPEMLTNSLGIVNPGTLKFQRCHRLGQKKAGSNQPREIIVKFLYYPDRQLVWDRRKNVLAQIYT